MPTRLSPDARLVAAFLLLFASTAVLAHHSFSMFDMKQEIELSGTVHEFQWTNPHVFIELDVADGKGNTVRWTIEANSPRALGRVGWKRDSLRAGDSVKLLIHPLRNGKPGGALVKAILKDGTELGDANPKAP